MNARLFLLLWLSLSFGANAQKKPRPITVSIFNEATAIPFTSFITTPFHPGIQLGTSFNYLNTQHSGFFQTVNVCYFYHNYLAQGVGLFTEAGYEYRIKAGLAFSALLGAGYMHTFTTSEEFTFENGKYVKRADYGNARLYPSFSLDAGYYLKKGSKTSSKIFIRYQSWVEYPYSPDFIPIMPHINLHVGATFFVNTNNRKND